MQKITKLGPLGLQLIKDWEGFSATPYLCPASICTIGFGSTRYENGDKVKLTDPPISLKRAEQLLMNTLITYEKSVDSFCIDAINQNQFDALTSFCYNIGPNALKSSTLLKKVNRNPNDPDMLKQFMKWVYADGKVLNGLKNRRLAEAKLYYL